MDDTISVRVSPTEWGPRQPGSPIILGKMFVLSSGIKCDTPDRLAEVAVLLKAIMFQAQHEKQNVFESSLRRAMGILVFVTDSCVFLRSHLRGVRCPNTLCQQHRTINGEHRAKTRHVHHPRRYNQEPHCRWLLGKRRASFYVQLIRMRMAHGQSLLPRRSSLCEQRCSCQRSLASRLVRTAARPEVQAVAGM